MMALDGNATTNLWRRTFRCSPVAYLLEGDVVVADDGSFCLLASAPREWTVLKKDSEPLITPTGPMAAQTLFLGRDDSFAETDTLDGKPILRIWNRDEDQWRAYWVLDGAVVKPTPEMERQWNEAALKTIRARIDRARQGELQKKVTAISPKLSKLTASAMSPLKSGELKEIHYEFLATRRVPSDRVLLEHLLDHHSDFEPQMIWGSLHGSSTGMRASRMGSFFVKRRNDYSFELADYERQRGDLLLGIFDQKVTRKRSLFLVLTEQPLIHLGTIRGTIRLPAPIPPHGGPIRIYLAPEDQAGKRWDESETDAIVAPLMPSPNERYGFIDEISFGFLTTRPGRYKVKAIWDKRPRYVDVRSAGPGDYESAWSGPITLTAGGSVEGIRLQCTNRVAGGEAYYQADEFLLKQAMAGNVSIFKTTADKNERTELFTAGFSKWVISTNFHTKAGGDGLGRIALLAAVTGRGTNDLTSRTELCVEWRNSSFLRGETVVSPTTLFVLDEHGCAYEPNFRKSERLFSMATFSAFPRSAATWRLVAYGPGGTSDLLFDYGLTNLVRSERKHPAKPQPLPAEVTLGNVRMEVSHVSGFSAHAWTETTFTEDGEPTRGWWVSDAIFEDDDGNVLDPEEMCREQKTTRVIGRIARNSSDLPDEKRDFEFTIERLKVFVAKQP
jgi:hypothetical protein